MIEPIKDREGRLLIPVQGKLPTSEELRLSGYKMVEITINAEDKKFVVVEKLMSVEERLLALELNELTKTEELASLKAEFKSASTAAEKIAIIARALKIIDT